MSRPTTSLLLLAAVVLVTPACVWDRHRINETLLETADTTQLVVGTSTIEDCLDVLGPPAVTDEFELFDKFFFYPRHMRYSVADRRTNGMFILPTYVIGIFNDSDKQNAKELMLLFDEEGVLSHAFLGGRESVFAWSTSRDDRVIDVTQDLRPDR